MPVMRRGQHSHRCVRCLTFFLSKDSLSVMRLMVSCEHSSFDDLFKYSISWDAVASCPQMAGRNGSGHFVMDLLSFLFVINFYPALVFIWRQVENTFLIQIPLLEKLMFLFHAYDVVDWSSFHIQSAQCDHLLENVLSIMII